MTGRLEMRCISAQVLLGGNKRDGQLFQPLTLQYLGARRRGYKTILFPENVRLRESGFKEARQNSFWWVQLDQNAEFFTRKRIVSGLKRYISNTSSGSISSNELVRSLKTRGRGNLLSLLMMLKTFNLAATDAILKVRRKFMKLDTYEPV